MIERAHKVVSRTDQEYQDDMLERMEDGIVLRVVVQAVSLFLIYVYLYLYYVYITYKVCM